MKLLILGATGRTGRALVQQAIERGHRVTAYVRSPHAMNPTDGVAVVTGNPRDAAQLRDAVAGCDAVISALGPPLPPASLPRRTTILGDGARAAVEAMSAAGVRRLLIISGDLMFPDAGPPWLVRVLLLRHLARDQTELERATQASALDWTIVRPARLTNGPLSREFRAAQNQMPERPRAISRADVACFLLDATEGRRHVGEVVGLAR